MIRWPAVSLAVVLAGVLGGCGDGGSSESDDPPPAEPGLHTSPVTVGGVEYEHLLFVPASYQPETPTPLVVMLHGQPGDGFVIAGASGMNELAEQAGFLVSYPTEMQQVSQLRELVDQLSGVWNVAAGQVYAAGFSAGGTASWRLAAQASDQFAAVASVGGPYRREAEPPAEPVSALQVAGLTDYGWIRQIETGVANWREQRDCTGDEPTWLDQRETASRTVATCPDGSELVEIRVAGLAHRWPPAIAGTATGQLIWDFFAAHQRT